MVFFLVKMVKFLDKYLYILFLFYIYVRGMGGFSVCRIYYSREVNRNINSILFFLFILLVLLGLFFLYFL